MLTRSGGKVFSNGRLQNITLGDVSGALGRVPRFGGHTVGDGVWTVAHHALLCDDIATNHYGEAATPKARLALLMHDAHEAFTGDIPAPLKTASVCRLQEIIDRHLFTAWFGDPLAVYKFDDLVSEIDLRSLAAEALVVGPAEIITTDDAVKHGFGWPRHEDCGLVEELKGVSASRAGDWWGGRMREVCAEIGDGYLKQPIET
jgi:hypothetical protein